MIEQWFADWNKNTIHLSSSTQILLDDNCDKITDMGLEAIPFLLSKLEGDGAHCAMIGLSIIAVGRGLIEEESDSPVKQEHRGIVKEMAKDWQEWGKANGFLASSSGT